MNIEGSQAIRPPDSHGSAARGGGF